MPRSRLLILILWISITAIAAVSVSGLGGRYFTHAATPAQTSSQAGAQNAEGSEPFYIHEFHANLLDLDCSTCHAPSKPGSVDFARPGHAQCIACHQPAFEQDLNPKLCGQCHSDFPPTGADNLLPFPLYAKKRALLFDFSHAKHVDSHARIDPKTGFRADCTFCHKFDEKGLFASFPRHTECAACHGSGGATPTLTADSATEDCRGCHSPEEIENPGHTKQRIMIADHVVSGVHVNLKFSHVAHFRTRDKYNLQCTTCHYAVPASTSLANLTLPKMVDCVGCHDGDKDMPEQSRMSNCQTCHIETQTGSTPASHTRFVRPDFHNESFRFNHERQASEPGAKCSICHLNVSTAASALLSAPSPSGANQCISCHQVMKPASHTARWRDDVHGKIAAMDRQACATCHATETCVRCHNQTPRSHTPLAFFAAGGHARPAMLDQRSCMTCHTFENTCAACHIRGQ
jgi:hypothetical protein